MPTLMELLEDFLSSPTPYESAQSEKATSNMGVAERRVGEWHDMAHRSYPRYHPEIPRDFSSMNYGPEENDNLIRDIDASGMNQEAGIGNYIRSPEARQVLLGIAESQYRNQHPESNYSSMRQESSEQNQGDMEITIKKKAPKPQPQGEGGNPNPFDNRMIRSKP